MTEQTEKPAADPAAGEEQQQQTNPELDQLAADAARVDAGDQPPPGEQPRGEKAREGEHQISTVRLVQGALLGAGGLMAMRYPAVKRVYTQERCGMVAEAVAPVLERWGVNARDSVTMQYVVAIGALALLGMDTIAAVKASTHDNGPERPPGAPDPKPVP